MTELPTTKDWLVAIGLGQYADVIAENDVDLDVAAELNNDDLQELGLSLGHRKKFLRADTEPGVLGRGLFAESARYYGPPMP